MAELIIPTANPLPIGSGGTGQTTATTAFDALAPSSPAQGDVLYYNGTHWVRLAAGTSGQFLQTQGSSANPQYASGFYTLMAQHGATSPSASQTLFWGSGYNGVASTTNATLVSLIIPKTGTVRRVDLLSVNATRDASSETSTLALRLNNTTDTTLSSTLSYNLGAAPSRRTIAFTGLSISVNAGDYVEFKWICAAWVTTPQATVEHAVIYVEAP